MGTLWRALLEGFGWQVGKAAAKDALETLEETLGADDRPPPDPMQIAAAQRAREQAAARAAKAREEQKVRESREIDAELRRLKKKVRRGG